MFFGTWLQFSVFEPLLAALGTLFGKLLLISFAGPDLWCLVFGYSCSMSTECVCYIFPLSVCPSVRPSICLHVTSVTATPAVFCSWFIYFDQLFFQLSASWGHEVVLFLRHSCKFLTDENIGAQRFNFATMFPQNRLFSALNFVFFSDKLKCNGAVANCFHAFFPAVLPPRHCLVLDRRLCLLH